MFERLLVIESLPGLETNRVINQLRQTPLAAETEVCRVIPEDLPSYDGAVLLAVSADLTGWIERIHQRKHMPVFWWYPVPSLGGGYSYPDEARSLAGLDGFLHTEMSPEAIAFALKLGLCHFETRNRLAAENDQLRNKLEERKVIDRAKEILAELKGISLTEAYQFLRKQAMEERRNIMDISRSIVTAYRLIRSERDNKRR